MGGVCSLTKGGGVNEVSILDLLLTRVRTRDTAEVKISQISVTEPLNSRFGCHFQS